MYKNIFKVLLLSIAFMVLSTGCMEDDKELKTIRLGIYKGEPTSLIYLARDRGYFEELGLNVIFDEYDSGKIATDELEKGNCDISTATISRLVSLVFNDPGYGTFGSISRGEINSLIYRTDSGIKSAKDLKGKKIAILKGSATEQFFGNLLTKNYLTLSDLEIVDMPPLPANESIKSGEIDGSFSWEPHIYNLKKEMGDEVSIFKDEDPEVFTFTFIANKEWINNNPNEIELFLKAIIKAETYLKHNNDEVKSYVKDLFNFSDEYINYIWPKYIFDVSLSQSLIYSMRDKTQWLIDENLIPEHKLPDFYSFIETYYLKEIKPESVTILEQNVN